MSTPAMFMTTRAGAPTATSAESNLISRNWFQLMEWNLDVKACCKSCGARCSACSIPRRARGVRGVYRLQLSVSRGISEK